MMTKNIRLGAGLAWLILGLSLFLASGVRADEDTARLEEQRAAGEESEARQREVQARLEEAQARLEEAAREVAELSARLTEDGLYLAIRGLEAIGPRPMLGVNIGRTPETEGPGVHIIGVTPEGPSDKAGLRAGDVIVAIDDEDLVGADGEKRLSAYMKEVEAGQEVSVRYRRDGEERTVTVVPEEMDPMRLIVGAPGSRWEMDLEGLPEMEELAELEAFRDGEHFHFRTGLPGRWGDLELVGVTPDLGEYFGVESGLLVVRAPEDDTLGLKDGDVILAIDGREPTSPRHAMRILRSYETGETISFSIVRGKKRRTVEVDLPARQRESHGRLWRRPVPPPAPARSPAPPEPALPPPVGT